MTDDNYSKFSCPGGKGMIINSMKSSLLPCLHHPDDYLNAGVTLKDSISTKVAIAELNDNRKIFVKRYNNKSLRYTLRYLFRATRPFRVLKAVQRLKQLNIPTPDILAILSKRKFSIIPDSSYVFHEYWDNCLTAKEYFELLYNDPDMFKESFDTITGYLAKMHHAGIRHNDLKVSNICCRRHDSHFIFGFWDLDGIMILNSPTPTEFIYIDMARLISSWLSPGKAVNIVYDREEITDYFTKYYSNHSDFIFDRKRLDKIIDRFLKRKKRNKQK
jgi:tRNA A-37 threonylcarbamoyl transferase component Bud32